MWSLQQYVTERRTGSGDVLLVRVLRPVGHHARRRGRRSGRDVRDRSARRRLSSLGRTSARHGPPPRFPPGRRAVRARGLSGQGEQRLHRQMIGREGSAGIAVVVDRGLMRGDVFRGQHPVDPVAALDRLRVSGAGLPGRGELLGRADPRNRRCGRP